MPGRTSTSTPKSWPHRWADVTGLPPRPLRILGLDPGSRHTGYGLIETDGGSLRAIAHGRFSSSSAKPVAERLAHMATELTALLARWQPETAVLETPFLGMNPRSLVVLAEARGALLAVLAAQGLEIDEYTPAEVKNAVTGNGRADKSQVAKMVGLHLSLADTQLSEDASDALAIAICFAHRGRMDRILSGRE